MIEQCFAAQCNVAASFGRGAGKVEDASVGRPVRAVGCCVEFGANATHARIKPVILGGRHRRGRGP